MNTKIILSAAVVVGCAVVGLVSLAGSTVSGIASFKEVPKKARAERLEVYGKLDKDSIRCLRGHNLVAFNLIEEKTGDRLAVLYENPGTSLPANFPAASHARAAGTYDPTQHKLIADRVFTKCPSKYEEKGLDLATKGAVDKWRSAAAKTEGS